MTWFSSYTSPMSFSAVFWPNYFTLHFQSFVGCKN